MVQSEDQMQILYYESILKTKNNIGKLSGSSQKDYISIILSDRILVFLFFTNRSSYTYVKYSSEFCQLSHRESSNADKFLNEKTKLSGLDRHKLFITVHRKNVHTFFDTIGRLVYGTRYRLHFMWRVTCVSNEEKRGGRRGWRGWGEGKCCITRA
jgi:hypothetical protein